MYAETVSDGSLSQWETILEDSLFRLAGADGGGGVYVIQVFGSAGEIYSLDDNRFPAPARTLASSNVTWHDSMADGYNIVEHSGSVWIYTENGTYKAYAADRYAWFPPFFQELEPFVFAGSTYVNVQSGFKSLSGGWITAYSPDISEYPPRVLRAIWDSSPATPSTHSRDHSDLRRAINAVSWVLGTSLKADYDSLQQRLDAIEQRLGMTSATALEIDEYPPLPLDARTNQSPATPGAHSMDHTDERIAINAIARVLGVLPQGSKPSLQIRVEQAENLSYNN
jgi:hypothetical protein